MYLSGPKHITKENKSIANRHSNQVLQLPAVPALQLKEDDEDILQGKFETTQRKNNVEQTTLSAFIPVVQKKENNTGLPDHLKSGVENLSGFSMDDVKVHFSSDKPAQLNALAYAQGTDIHVANGEEKHLPHEAWHVVQQKQGRVQATMQMKSGVPVNDDVNLEKEADIMGSKALIQDKINPVQKPAYIKDEKLVQGKFQVMLRRKHISNIKVVQRYVGSNLPKGTRVKTVDGKEGRIESIDDAKPGYIVHFDGEEKPRPASCEALDLIELIADVKPDPRKEENKKEKNIASQTTIEEPTPGLSELITIGSELFICKLLRLKDKPGNFLCSSLHSVKTGMDLPGLIFTIHESQRLGSAPKSAITDIKDESDINAALANCKWKHQENIETEKKALVRKARKKNLLIFLETLKVLSEPALECVCSDMEYLKFDLFFSEPSNNIRPVLFANWISQQYQKNKILPSKENFIDEDVAGDLSEQLHLIPPELMQKLPAIGGWKSTAAKSLLMLKTIDKILNPPSEKGKKKEARGKEEKPESKDKRRGETATKKERGGLNNLEVNKEKETHPADDSTYSIPDSNFLDLRIAAVMMMLATGVKEDIIILALSNKAVYNKLYQLQHLLLDIYQVLKMNPAIDMTGTLTLLSTQAPIHGMGFTFEFLAAAEHAYETILLPGDEADKAKIDFVAHKKIYQAKKDYTTLTNRISKEKSKKKEGGGIVEGLVSTEAYVKESAKIARQYMTEKFGREWAEAPYVIIVQNKSAGGKDWEDLKTRLKTESPPIEFTETERKIE